MKLLFLKNNKMRIFFFVLIGIILAGAFLYYNSQLTGRASFEVDIVYKEGEPLDGEIRFRIRAGELVPVNSVIVVNYAGQTKSFPLAELAHEATIDGTYYAEDSELSGEGEGYGVLGNKVIAPTVNFELEIFTRIEEPEEEEEEVGEEEPEEEVEEEETEEEVGEEEPETGEEETEETPKEEKEKPEKKEDKDKDKKDKEKSKEGGITGEAVTEESYTIEGSVSLNEEFEYKIEEGQSARIVPGSVTVNGESVSDNLVSLDVDKKKITVTTQYFINEEGFGEEYLGDFALTLYIDVIDFELTAEPGVLEIVLEHNGIKISSHKEGVAVVIPKKIKEDKNETNETIPAIPPPSILLIENIPSVRIPFNGKTEIDLSKYFEGAESYSFDVPDITASFDGDIMTLTPDAGFSGARNGRVAAYAKKESLESNEFTILVSSGAVNIQTTREKIRVGEKARWKKVIEPGDESKVSVEIPIESSEIRVEKKLQSGDIVEEIPQTTEIGGSVLSGQVVTEIELGKPGFGVKIKKWFKEVFADIKKGITGGAVSEIPNEGGIDIILEEDAGEDVAEYIISYETPAPTKAEREINRGKEITISGDDKFNYENVIAFTELETGLSVSEKDRIKLYWIVPPGKSDLEIISAATKTPDEVPDEDIIEEESIATEASAATVTEEPAATTTEEPSITTAEEPTVNVIDENVTVINETNISFNTNVRKRVGSLTGRAISVGEGEGITVEEGEAAAPETPETIIVPETEIASAPALEENVLSDEDLQEAVGLESLSEGNVLKQEILFDAYDLDADGDVEYLEWVVPHLSEQNYQIIIEITKAEHLDSNRSFISDIYEDVKALDENWSETIPSGDYVRVTFEQNLTSDKDITVYPRIAENSTLRIDGREVPYEIYLKKKRIDEIRRMLG